MNILKKPKSEKVTFFKNAITILTSFVVSLVLIIAVIIITTVHTFSIEYYSSNKNTYFDSVANPKKYKIGLVTAKNNIGETASAKYSCKAAINLGWDCYVFSYDDLATYNSLSAFYLKKILSIIDSNFQPDFIIYKYPYYIDISNHKIPNYLTLFYDLSKIFKEKETNSTNNSKAWSNIGNFDGYISYNPNHDWLDLIDIKSLVINKNINIDNKLFITYSYPTTNYLGFRDLDYLKIFYSGHNWDNLRSSEKYKSIFKLLAKEKLISVYGPENAWGYIEPSAYKGMFYGEEFIKKMQDAGIALSLHSQMHLDTGIPANRIFEAAAASTLIISDEHAFVKKNFDNCVLYINFSKPIAEVAKQLKEYLKWAQDNPKAAKNMAKCAHDIFKGKFTMEQSLLDTAKMHEEIMRFTSKNY